MKNLALKHCSSNNFLHCTLNVTPMAAANSYTGLILSSVASILLTVLPLSGHSNRGADESSSSPAAPEKVEKAETPRVSKAVMRV